MTFPRSFIELKLVCMVLFIVSYLLSTRKFKIFPEIFFFYAVLAILGIVGSIVGYFNGGDVKGITGNFRLWFFWSIAYLIIFTIIRNENNLKVIHVSVAISGILIFMINFFSLLNYYYNWGIINSEITKALWMNIGIHKGYVQMSSHNIGSLFFIMPYLTAIYFRKDKENINSKLIKVSIICSLIIAVLSGRRALWLVIVITPILVAALSYISGSVHLLTRSAKRIMKLLLFLSVGLLIGITYLLQNGTIINGTLNHIKSAFASSDPRSIQEGYLFEGFLKYPVFGSGFGMSTPYIRSNLTPWSYEMTYNQLLFNFGLVGSFVIFLLFLFYIYFVVLLVRRNKDKSIVAFSILIGFISFSIGAYSNPYFGSFDFLLIIGMIPFLATFKNGYQIS